MLDPLAKTIELSRLTEKRYGEPRIISEGRCASSVIPGFEIDLADLFADGLAV